MGELQSPSFSLGQAVIAVSLLLMGIGVVMAASTGARVDGDAFDVWSVRSPMVRQLSFALAGVVILLVSSRVNPKWFAWRGGCVFQPAMLVLLVAVVLLAAVWVPQIGRVVNGRRRWLTLGPVGFQPSELAKPALVIFLSAWLARVRAAGGGVKGPGFLVPAVAIVAVCGLVGTEDFGTAVLLAAVGGLMLLVGGCRVKTLLAWSVPAVGALAFLLVSQPYRLGRLTSFLHYWDDPLGKGFHPIQSLAAIASGGWTGRGLGAGLSKFGYLPESRTDFVFAVICEETGVVGGMVVIGLFAVLGYVGLRAMLAAPKCDVFARLLAFGLTATICLQALINVAVVTVMAPTKGISLPFVSAGGSGLVCFAMGMGLLASVARWSHRQAAEAGGVAPVARGRRQMLEVAV